MGEKRKPQEPKIEAFELYLEFFRYALANKIHPLRVVGTNSVSPAWLKGKASFVQVLIGADGIPIVNGPRPLPLSPRMIEGFFESWELQEFFLIWLGRRIAEVTPRTARGKKLKKSFAHLTVGQLGKLPPRIVLQAQNNRLVIEIKQMQEKFPLSALPTEKQRKAIFEYGRETSASWLPDATKDPDLLQSFTETPSVAAELILATRYGCERETIHARLFRVGL